MNKILIPLDSKTISSGSRTIVQAIGEPYPCRILHYCTYISHPEYSQAYSAMTRKMKCLFLLMNVLAEIAAKSYHNLQE